MRKIIFCLIISFFVLQSNKIVKLNNNYCIPSKEYYIKSSHISFLKNNNLVKNSDGSEKIHGKKIIIRGKLLDKNCVPVSDAIVNLWNAGSNFSKNFGSSFKGAGTSNTNNLGEFLFITEILSDKNSQTSYLNCKISHRMINDFTTRIFINNNQEYSFKPEIIKSKLDKEYHDSMRNVTIILPYELKIKKF